jgi:Domain of unknown function (DUF4124)
MEEQSGAFEEDQSMLKSVMVASCLLAAAFALQTTAQTLYKSVLPDGRVVYGDKPDPDAVKVDETKPDVSKRGIGGSTPREAAALQEMEKARANREVSEERVRAAEQALKKAETDRLAGRDPLSDERIGTAGGTSRLTDSYFERQKKLEDDVQKARRELEQIRTGR